MFSNPESREIFFWNWIKIIILPLKKKKKECNRDKAYTFVYSGYIQFSSG